LIKLIAKPVETSGTSPTRVTAWNRSDSGGSKIGCMLNLVFLLIIALVGLRIYPVYYSNNQFTNAIEEIAGQAANLSLDTIQAQILAKAKDYSISEALAPGALSVSKLSENDGGVCTVKVNYIREVNIYGFATIKMTTNKEIVRHFIHVGHNQSN